MGEKAQIGVSPSSTFLGIDVLHDVHLGKELIQCLSARTSEDYQLRDLLVPQKNHHAGRGAISVRDAKIRFG
jgi:hypothetical protein